MKAAISYCININIYLYIIYMKGLLVKSRLSRVDATQSQFKDDMLHHRLTMVL